MNATAKKTMVLEFRWTTSRARESYGYNVCTLYVDGVKVARCNGGGYDMKGTCYGSFIASHYADRLRDLKAEDMPAQSHWEREYPTPTICRNTACVVSMIEDGKELERHPHDAETCPHCGGELTPNYNAGQRIDDGRYFYGLTFHDPNYDPAKAVIGVDCTDRTLGGGAAGETVEQAEAEGKSFGLERYQAAYKASSKVPTDRHTEPYVDGACGFSTVEKIAEAIGLSLKYIPTRKKDDSLYELIDSRS